MQAHDGTGEPCVDVVRVEDRQQLAGEPGVWPTPTFPTPRVSSGCPACAQGGRRRAAEIFRVSRTGSSPSAAPRALAREGCRGPRGGAAELRAGALLGGWSMVGFVASRTTAVQYDAPTAASMSLAATTPRRGGSRAEHPRHCLHSSRKQPQRRRLAASHAAARAASPVRLRLSARSEWIGSTGPE
jgi:hypothetical protein